MSRSALGCTTVLLAAMALLTGCGSVQTPAKAQPSKGAPKSVNACKDAKSDAATNDLTSVALKRDGDVLDVTWTMTKRDTGTGTAGFYLNLVSEDSSAAGQLGVRYLDSRQIAYFTFRGAFGGSDKEITGSAQVTATSVTGSFPMSELAQYGPNFKWQAATTRDGKDMDACPGFAFTDMQRLAG